MKVTSIICILLLMSTQAFAKKKKKRRKARYKISSLHYLPAKGKFLTKARLNLYSQTQDIDGSTSETKNSEKSLEFSTIYGLNKKLHLEFTLPFMFSGKEEDTGSTVEEKYSGLKDLTLGATYRLSFAKNRRRPNVDLHFSLSPSLGDKENYSTQGDGNALRGGTLLTLGGSYIRTFYLKEMKKKFEARGNVTLAYNGEVTQTSVGSTSSQKTDSAIDLHFKTLAQYYIDRKSYVNAGLEFAFFGSRKTTTSPTVVVDTDRGLTPTLIIGGGHELTANKTHLFGSLELSKGSYEYSSGGFTGKGSLSQTHFNLGLRHLF